MNSSLEHLVLLQAQDMELRRMRAELEAAPRRVAAADVTRGQAEAAKVSTEKSLVREEALRGSQELETADRRAKIARLRKQMDTAVSAAQITALEHEIHFAEAAIEKLEEEELTSLERTDTLESRRVEAVRALDAATKALDSERSQAAEQKSHHEASIREMEQERKAMRAAIEEGLLAKYDHVTKSRGTGVAAALDGGCSACRMKLRAQRWNDLTGREHAGDVFTCESCGRILFWDPRHDAPGEWPAGDRLGAAVALLEGRR